MAEEWVAKCEREERAPITLEKIRWLLGMAYPMIGTLPISKITPQEVLAVLRKVEATGRYESARRMRSVLSRVFRYGIATARADRDVAADLRGALITPKVQHLAAITTPKEAGGLLRAIEGYTGHEITAIALRLSPHLFVRPGELRSAEWTEFDTPGAVWSLSAEKMKMRRPHRVPLSRQVLNILEELQALTGDGRFLFPSFRSPKQCMSENTVNAALRRLGYPLRFMVRLPPVARARPNRGDRADQTGPVPICVLRNFGQAIAPGAGLPRTRARPLRPSGDHGRSGAPAAVSLRR